jgi:predicted ABC-type ATPase
MADTPIMNVYAGGPGTGKTTLGKMFSQGSDIPFLNPADKSNSLAANMTDAAAYKAFVEKIHSFIDNKQSFSLETNLSDEAISLMQEAKAKGFEVNTHYLAVNAPDIQVERLEKKGNVDDLRLENLEKYNGTSLKNVSDALYLSDKGVVYNNSGIGPVEAMELRNGVITDLSSVLPGPVQDKLSESMTIREGATVVPSREFSLSVSKGFGM